MRILLTTDTVGGVWTFAQELVTGLLRGGVEVTLVSFGEMPELSQMHWTEGLRGLDFRPTPFRLEWMQDAVSDIVDSSEYLLNIIRETEPDLLHFSQYCYGSLPVDIPKIITAHSDVVSWWHSVHGDDPPACDWTHWYHETITAGLGGADAVSAPSRWMLSQMEEHYGALNNPTVIYNGRAPQHFNPHAEKQDRVVSIGRLWDEAKQVSLLVDSGLKCPITIAGSIASPQQGSSSEKPVFRQSVELRDKLTDIQVRSLLADASIYAATSRYEPFGLAPLEAALSRCALVANDIPSFRELWGPTAVYFPANDAEGLRAGVEKLRRDHIVATALFRTGVSARATPLQRRLHGGRVSEGLLFAGATEECGGVSGRIRFCYFAHSWISDWNHGNAHFLRGLVRELQRLGHEVRCYEQYGSWSLTNLVDTEGEKAQQAIEQFRSEFPNLDVRLYQNDSDLADALRLELKDADVVIVHEWNDPEVVNAILSLKRELGFVALLHDTHHRAHTNPGELLRFHLELFDGVLAFGEAIQRIYVEGFGVERAWTFHEAADVSHFVPRQEEHTYDLLWIGNWGDEERTRELSEFLIEPAVEIPDLRAVVYGVRYPDEGKAALAAAEIEYRGYLPNLMAPAAYAKSALALHIPRRLYANGLAGIPTIRVFEALACGVPLLCAPWQDAEHLFRPGEDYLVANSGTEMKSAIQWLLRDDAARLQIAANGRETILQRHTCAHRAAQMVEICTELMQ